MEQENKQELQGWKDVQLNPDMSVSMLVGFLNVLNQRLVTLENIITIPDGDGKMINLTDYYARQAQAEIDAQTKAKEESKGE